jgi:hypothetical protein
VCVQITRKTKRSSYREKERNSTYADRKRIKSANKKKQKEIEIKMGEERGILKRIWPKN